VCTVFAVRDGSNGIVFVFPTSISFLNKLYDLWKLNTSIRDIISLVLSTTRIAPLNNYISFNFYITIYIILIAMIFFYSLLICLALQINEETSKLYQLNISIIRYTSRSITLILFIPISEYTLSVLKCNNSGYIYYFDSGVTCWMGLHLLMCFISIIFTAMFFMIVMFIIIFYFEPFIKKKSSLRYYYFIQNRYKG